MLIPQFSILLTTKHHSLVPSTWCVLKRCHNEKLADLCQIQFAELHAHEAKELLGGIPAESEENKKTKNHKTKLKME